MENCDIPKNLKEDFLNELTNLSKKYNIKLVICDYCWLRYIEEDELNGKYVNENNYLDWRK